MQTARWPEVDPRFDDPGGAGVAAAGEGPPAGSRLLLEGPMCVALVGD